MSNAPVSQLSVEDGKLLIEEYKAYLLFLDHAESKRAETSRFYGTMLTGLIALLPLVLNSSALKSGEIPWLLAVGSAGLALCNVWYSNLGAYRQLSASRWQVVHEMEQALPFHCFEREWELVTRQAEQSGPKFKANQGMTRIEQRIPLLMSVPYGLLMLYAVLRALVTLVPGLGA